MVVTTNETETVAANYPPMEMHGRRVIYTVEPEITSGNILQVLNKALDVHRSNRAEEEYLENYLRGIQPILYRIKKYNAEICNKIVVNFANEIVTFKTAEFAGQPIQYVSRGARKNVPELLEKLNSMLISEGKQSKDMELAYKMFTNGVAYRLILNDKSVGYNERDNYDEAPFEIYIPEPKNTFLVRLNDVTKRPVMGVTYVYLDKNAVRYTVYTPNITYTVDGTTTRAQKIVRMDVHNFGMIPLIEYPCNSIYMGAFEPVLPLMDAYNLTMSDRMDGVEQYIQALMVLKGVDLSREDFLALKDLGAIKLPPAQNGSPTDVYYLNDQLDQSQTQTLIDDIYNTILQIVGMPSQGNGNTSDSSNNGAIILKNGWWSAEARALETEGVWRQAETEFLKVILKICEQANALDGLSVSDVQPKFGRHSYEDKLTKTQSFTTLIGAGCPPIQAYTISGIVTDPEAAAIQFEAYRAEQETHEEERLNAELDREREMIENDSTVSTGGQGNSATQPENGASV